MTSKTCFKCQENKPLSMFYKHARMADGHLNKCKDCTKLDVANNRVDNIERIRAYDKMRASMPHRVAKAKEIQKKWREEHPERRAAQIALGNAVSRGRVEKLPCMVCGGKSEAHHPDYSRPLDVVWLCPPHHKQAHALA